MIQSQLNEKQLEELKKKLQIDEKIAAKHNISVHQVERDFDPRLLRVILGRMPQKTGGVKG